jgi:hypothetical protein
MIAPNFNKICEEAERHYFDVLRDEAERPVPTEVMDHIMGCLYCREQVSRLEAILAECKEHSQAHPAQMATIAILKLHFSFVGKPVNCADVRPFLPNLLAAITQIRIPTPITAHIDKCEQCKEDSKKLQSLNLSHKHLITLSQMFADELDDDEMDCAAAREAIPAVVAMAFDQTDAKTLRHLSLCVKCREELYRYREAILQQTKSRRVENGNQENRFPCESIGVNDVFDYCVPYGIDPTSDEYAKFRKSLTTHVVCCADCIDKIQQLHRTVYDIAERPESGIVTVFHVDKAAQTKSQSEEANPYGDFPVRVERAAMDNVERPYVEEQENVVKLRSVSRKLKPVLKFAIPAAAVLMLGIGLFFNVNPAKGLGLGEIYKAVNAIQNIHITNIDPDNQKTVYEVWIARNSGLYIIKTENECVLRDTYNRIRKDKELDTGIIKQAKLSGDALTSIATRIHSSLDIMPFSKLSDIPAGSKWSELTDSGLAFENSNTKVYELTWTQAIDNGSTIQRSQRIFADASTNLPQKIHCFKQDASDPEPVLETIVNIEYPSEEEILARAEAMSF